MEEKLKLDGTEEEQRAATIRFGQKYGFIDNDGNWIKDLEEDED